MQISMQHIVNVRANHWILFSRMKSGAVVVSHVGVMHLCLADEQQQQQADLWLFSLAGMHV